MKNIAKKYFGCVDVDMEAVRFKKRSIKTKQHREFDYILICNDILLINETKSNPRSEYAKEFVDFIKSGEIWDYFEEYKDKKLIPIFSTLHLPNNVLSYLTSNNIYAVAMKGDEMDVLNYNEVKK